MSQGTPTSLVRDGKVEGSDPVADEPFKVTPVRIEGEAHHDGSDQRRADDAEVDLDSREQFAPRGMCSSRAKVVDFLSIAAGVISGPSYRHALAEGFVAGNPVPW